MANEHLPVVPGTAQQFQKYLFSKELKEKFQLAVPKWLSVDRLLRIVFSSVLKNPKLLECTTESLMGAIMQCAQLGLEPILGRAYLIPYRNNKKKGKPLECQFQPGYQGLVDLAERSGKIETVKAHVVYEHDEFEIEYGLNERLVHRPKMDGDRGKPIGAYTVWTRKSGVKTYSFMLLDDIYRDFRSKSVAYNYAIRDKRDDTPWIENEPEMLKKSLVKRHSKLEPASVDFMEAVEIDNMADIGQPSQVALLNNLPTDMDKEDNAALVAQFDATIPKDVGSEALQKFLAVCSKHFDKSVDEIKAEAIKDPKFWNQFRAWESKQKEPEKPDPIRKLYKGLGDKKFREFINSHRDAIPAMPQKYQDEIYKSWKKRFKDEPYPVNEEPKTPTGIDPNMTVDRLDEDDPSQETQDEKILRLIPEAEMDAGMKQYVVPCPEREGNKVASNWCQGNCEVRENCKTWTDYDAEGKE